MRHFVVKLINKTLKTSHFVLKTSLEYKLTDTNQRYEFRI